MMTLRTKLKKTDLTDDEKVDIEKQLASMNRKTRQLDDDHVKCGCGSIRQLSKQSTLALQRRAQHADNPKYCFCDETHERGRKTDAARMSRKVAYNRERRQATLASHEPDKVINGVIHRLCKGCAIYRAESDFNGSNKVMKTCVACRAT